MDQNRSSVEPDPIAFMWACVVKVLEADGNPSPVEVARRAAAAGLALSENTFTGWFEVWPVTPRRVVPQWRTFHAFTKALSAEKDRDWRAVWDAAQRAKNEAARREREASPPPAEPGRARVGDTSPATLGGSGAVPFQTREAAAEEGTTTTPRRGPRSRRGVVVGTGIAVVLLVLVAGGVWKLAGGAGAGASAGPGITGSSTRCDRYAVAPDDLWLRDEYGSTADGELVHGEQVTVLSRRGPTGGKYWEVRTDGGTAGWVDHSYLRPLCVG